MGFRGRGGGQPLQRVPQIGTFDSNSDQRGPEACHVYWTPGNYTVTLRVRGWNGNAWVEAETSTVHVYERQALTSRTAPTGGTYRLSLDGTNWTAAIPWNATSAQIEPLLEALPGMGPGTVALHYNKPARNGPGFGPAGMDIQVEFRGSVGGTTGFGLLQADNSQLLGATLGWPSYQAGVNEQRIFTGATVSQVTCAAWSGDTVYVDPVGGSDANPGTFAFPKQTLLSMGQDTADATSDKRWLIKCGTTVTTATTFNGGRNHRRLRFSCYDSAGRIGYDAIQAGGTRPVVNTHFNYGSSAFGTSVRDIVWDHLELGRLSANAGINGVAAACHGDAITAFIYKINCKMPVGVSQGITATNARVPAVFDIGWIGCDFDGGTVGYGKVQSIVQRVGTTVTGGTYTISGYNPLTDTSFTTVPIAYNADLATIQTAINDEFEGGGMSVELAGNPLPQVTTNSDKQITISFKNSQGSLIPAFTLDGTNLVGDTYRIGVSAWMGVNTGSVDRHLCLMGGTSRGGANQESGGVLFNHFFYISYYQHTLCRWIDMSYGSGGPGLQGGVNLGIKFGSLNLNDTDTSYTLIDGCHVRGVNIGFSAGYGTNAATYTNRSDEAHDVVIQDCVVVDPITHDSPMNGEVAAVIGTAGMSRRFVVRRVRSKGTGFAHRPSGLVQTGGTAFLYTPGPVESQTDELDMEVYDCDIDMSQAAGIKRAVAARSLPAHILFWRNRINLPSAPNGTTTQSALVSVNDGEQVATLANAGVTLVDNVIHLHASRFPVALQQTNVGFTLAEVEAAGKGSGNTLVATPIPFADVAALDWSRADVARVYLDGAPIVASGGSRTFRVRLGSGTLSGTLTVTPSDNGAGGTFSPSSVELTNSTRAALVTYTPTGPGAATVRLTSNQPQIQMPPGLIVKTLEAGAKAHARIGHLVLPVTPVNNMTNPSPIMPE